MKTVSIHDAKTNLSKYIATAKKGEKVYIGGFGKAEVVLTRLPIQGNAKYGKRSFLSAKGKITEKQDSFSVATDKSISALMYGS